MSLQLSPQCANILPEDLKLLDNFHKKQRLRVLV